MTPSLHRGALLVQGLFKGYTGVELTDPFFVIRNGRILRKSLRALWAKSKVDGDALITWADVLGLKMKQCKFINRPSVHTTLLVLFHNEIYTFLQNAPDIVQLLVIGYSFFSVLGTVFDSFINSTRRLYPHFDLYNITYLLMNGLNISSLIYLMAITPNPLPN